MILFDIKASWLVGWLVGLYLWNMYSFQLKFDITRRSSTASSKTCRWTRFTTDLPTIHLYRSPVLHGWSRQILWRPQVGSDSSSAAMERWKALTRSGVYNGPISGLSAWGDWRRPLKSIPVPFILMLFSNFLLLGLSIGHYPSGVPTKILCVFFVYPH